MRRYLSTAAFFTASATPALSWGHRHLRPGLSPVRSYNETIADAQNTFAWEKKHRFRPHQYFTYDPASWSRPLEEKAKQAHQLSLLARLRRLEERAAECVAATATVSGPSPDGETNEAAVLSEHLGRAVELGNALRMPRTARRMGLRQQARLRARYHVVLRQLFTQVSPEGSATTTTPLLEDVLRIWFVLLDAAAELIPALADAPDVDEAAAISVVFTALTPTLLAVVTRPEQAWLPPDALEAPATLESHIHALAILLHPFTRHGMRVWVGPETPLARAYPATLARLYPALRARLQRRMTGTAARRPWLDPVHLHALLAIATRVPGDVAADLPRLRLLVQAQADHLTRVLRDALPGAHTTWAGWRSSEDGEVPTAFGRSRGIERPPTRPDDVHHTLAAGLRLLTLESRACASAAASDALLRLLGHAPNFDLDAALLVRFVVGLLEAEEAGAGAGAGAFAARGLGWLLALSRLDVAAGAGEAETLARLALGLARVGAPGSQAGARTRRMEWQRLRGVTMERLLGVLTPAALAAAALHTPGGGCVSWEEQLAFRAYAGLIPRRLWEAACAGHFPAASPAAELGIASAAEGPGPSTAWVSPGPGVARALLVLRARLVAARRGSRRVPLEGTAVGYTAACVEALTSGRVSREALLASPQAWEACVGELGEVGEQVLPLLEAAKAYVTVHPGEAWAKVVIF